MGVFFRLLFILGIHPGTALEIASEIFVHKFLLKNSGISSRGPGISKKFLVVISYRIPKYFFVQFPEELQNPWRKIWANSAGISKYISWDISDDARANF